MSGIEIAGLVLGAFPIAVQLIQGYEEGCKPIGRWRKFHRTLKSLLQDIRHQKLCLEQNVRLFLEPLVEDEEEVQRLVQDPGGEAWKDKELDEALRRRLLSSYDLYLETIGSLSERLAEFQAKLSVQDDVRDEILQYFGKQRKSKAPSQSLVDSKKINWKREWDRIRISWSYDDLTSSVQEIERLNNRLHNLVKFGEKSKHGQQVIRKGQTKSIQKLRDQATALYDFLAKQWPCGCADGHRARVYLRYKAIGDAKMTDPTLIEIMMAVEGIQGSQSIWQGPLACALKQLSIQTPLSAPTSAKSSVKPRKGVKFQDEQAAPGAVVHEEPQSIQKDTQRSPSAQSDYLCTSLSFSNLDNVRKLGPFIEGQKQITLESTHDAASASPNEEPSLMSLSDLLAPGLGSPAMTTSASATPVRSLRIAERIRLALDLASSFFYIFDTPWFAGSWGKEDVQVADQKEPGNQRARTALLERRFPAKGKATSIETVDPSDALVRLGICLEELCFGRQLETFPEYTRCCGPDGKPHAQTAQAAIRELLSQVEGELGEHYLEAVEKCLAHSFQVDKSRFKQADFWQSAHDDIVGSLQRVVGGWFSKNP